MEAAAETKRDEGVGELGTIKQASKVLNSTEDAHQKIMSTFGTDERLQALPVRPTAPRSGDPLVEPRLAPI
jgi:hypothetical protein